MKDKQEILDNIEREEKYMADKNNPMDLDEWANHNGWIDALKWVLEIEDTYRKILPKKDITHLLKGANNDTIKRAHKRLAKELGFGRKDNDVDSQDDSIRDGLLYAPQQCVA
tara:strand:+ start:232 stop:567 length:336 start_codon:yes stop_codon:yes gene_type:complete